MVLFFLLLIIIFIYRVWYRKLMLLLCMTRLLCSISGRRESRWWRWEWEGWPNLKLIKNRVEHHTKLFIKAMQLGANCCNCILNFLPLLLRIWRCATRRGLTSGRITCLGLKAINSPSFFPPTTSTQSPISDPKSTGVFALCNYALLF